MVEAKECTFCGKKIEPGTGKLYIRTDGQKFNFCNSKCEKNIIEHGRKDRETKWTRKHAQEKAVKTYHKKEKEEPKKRIVKKKK